MLFDNRRNLTFLKALLIGLILVLAASPVALVANSDYHQAPELATLVKQDKLPPLGERLPENPKVYEVAKVGKYGGKITSGQGWKLGSMWPWTTSWTCNFEMAVDEGLTTTGQPDDTKAEPNLATHWEIGPDQKVYTFHLRKGVKWSDGVEFTADDVLFTYESILHPDLAALMNSRIREYLQGSKMYKIDKYTVQLEFERARKPEWVLLWMREGSMLQPGGFNIVPKHYYKEFHPKYNPDATLEDLVAAGDINKQPPVLGPWMPVRKAGGFAFFKRNPYYWVVDQNGNQLPYTDEFIGKEYRIEGSYIMGAIAGEHDLVPHGQAYGPFTTVLEQEAKRPYKVYMPPGKSSKNVGMTFNLDVPDESLRTLFRNRNFILAVSKGINREEIVALFPGSKPGYKPYYRIYGVPPILDNFDFWKPIWEEQKFDLEGARELLDGMGLKDVDNDGLREFPEDTPRAGEDFEATVLLETVEADRVRIAEATATMLKENLGLKFKIKPVEMSTYLKRVNEEGDFQVKASEGTYPMPWGFVSNPSGFTPLGPDSVPFWHQKTGWEHPFDWEVKARELIKQGQKAVVEDPEKAKELMVELQTILGKNCPWLGIVKFRSYFMIHERFANVPFAIYPSWRTGKGPYSQALPMVAALDLETWWDTTLD